MKFDFQLEDFAERLRGGAGDSWRELIILADEIIKLKQELRKLKKAKKKVINDE